MQASPFPVSSGLERVAVLDRTIGASIERVWENVLDWEHLPWLHRRDFASIELHEAGDWGWRARAASTARPEAPFIVELLVDRKASRYVSRTSSGDAAAAEIWTRLEPTAEHATDIHVEFWLPGGPAAAREELGAGYLRLYERLWDEDEAMMRERTERLVERGRGSDGAAPERLELGPFEALRAELPRCVELGGARWRLVALGDEIFVHDARCPHQLGPLVDEPADGQGSGEVQCPWHGYRFDVRTGHSCDGRRLRLRGAPRLRRDAESDVVTLELD